MAKLVTINKCLFVSIVKRVLIHKMNTHFKFNHILMNTRLNEVLMRNHCKYLSVTSRHAVDSNAGKDMDATDPLKDSAIKGTANDGQSSSRPLSSSPIDISDNCVKRLKKVLDKKEEMLRVEVLSGGCSGLEYRFHVTDKTTAEDVVFEKNGVKVVVDNESMQYLNGSTIDYSEELIKSSFRVLNNPQSQQGCSCGQSFALKLDNGFKFKT